MLLALEKFLAAEQGQDLTEYTLLMAFLVVVIMSLAGSFHDSISTVTSMTNTQLANADAASR